MAKEKVEVLDENLKIASVCRAARSLHGWNQQAMAKRMGITVQTLRKVEGGEGVATNYIHRIQKAAGLTLGEFDTLQDIFVNASSRLSYVTK